MNTERSGLSQWEVEASRNRRCFRQWDA